MRENIHDKIYNALDPEDRKAEDHLYDVLVADKAFYQVAERLFDVVERDVKLCSDIAWHFRNANRP